MAHSLRGVTPAVARYWEAFDARDGRRYVAFTQVKLAAADAAKLLERYTTRHQALGATTVPFFPELAWKYPKVTRGAVVMTLQAGSLQELGVAEKSVYALADKPNLLLLALDEAIAGDDEPVAVIDRPEVREAFSAPDPADQIRLAAALGAEALLRFYPLYRAFEQAADREPVAFHPVIRPGRLVPSCLPEHPGPEGSEHTEGDPVIPCRDV